MPNQKLDARLLRLRARSGSVYTRDRFALAMSFIEQLALSDSLLAREAVIMVLCAELPPGRKHPK